MHYTRLMGWEVEFTDEFGEWFGRLDEEAQDTLVAAVEYLARVGPGLGRPLVDTVGRSRHGNMKELRPPAGNVRVLFAFDSRRMAILLLGGDKTHRCREWYDRAIPWADDLYDRHLTELREEGLLP